MKNIKRKTMEVLEHKIIFNYAKVREMMTYLDNVGHHCCK